jgi:serine/threonine protein kinase
VHPDTEQNWSGRGQHVRFAVHEQPLINSILEVVDTIGSTRTATVQSVKCRRILLARKTILCGKRSMTPEEAISEVSHLTRLNHAHVLRVIGTYVKGRELSILLYPVADCNLEDYLQDLRTNTKPIMSDEWWEVYYITQSFYHCLSSAIHHIHQNLTKHMDIKPQNILIVKSPKGKRIKPMIADFGIARWYQNPEDIETDGSTSFTKRYAAPEVVRQDSRGLPADIFSLGCVFLEILAATQALSCGGLYNTLQSILQANVMSDTSYQSNLKNIQNALSEFWARYPSDRVAAKNHAILLSEMLDEVPQNRPTAEDLIVQFPEMRCCGRGTPKFKAMPTAKSNQVPGNHATSLSIPP